LYCISFINNDIKKAISDFFETLYQSVSVYADNSQDRLQIIFRENSEILHRYHGITIRNMSALGPLATPFECYDKGLFGKNTELEVSCAKNWVSILEKENSKAKIILCLNEINAKLVFSKQGYLDRIRTLISNLQKYDDKLHVVDSGSPLIMSNFDIYGDYVFLESIKTNVNNFGYNYLKVHRIPNDIKSNIGVFDRIFDSIKEENLLSAKKIYDHETKPNKLLKMLINSRLEHLIKRINENW
ncbi:MAG: hypothetical protein D3916_14150, partial [Candidatus Electrothrix sp. MAN1_4]|nr:hypothetical protein [Candidatus Electrothrix sp. MAN1_4]